MSTAIAAKPIRLGHAVIKMKDIAGAQTFYGDLVGLEVARRSPTAVFFRLGGDHHTLAVMQVGPDAAPPVKNQVGLYHLAFQVESLDALKALYQRLKAAGTELAGGGVTHGSSYSFYCFDPEGNELEFYADRYPGKDWTGEQLAGRNEPLNLDV
ncbi:MAG TPA: VOC family protein [Dehalococcoidia bacterium]|nr:VOC family protein [Dehalococcoidia bacterium]